MGGEKVSCFFFCWGVGVDEFHPFIIYGDGDRDDAVVVGGLDTWEEANVFSDSCGTFCPYSYWDEHVVIFCVGGLSFV